MSRTPQKLSQKDEDVFTPPLKSNLRDELKQVLMQRNLLTAKSKSKGWFHGTNLSNFLFS